jgi:hypothetical protein
VLPLQVRKIISAKCTKLVAMFFPNKSLGFWYCPFRGTWICSLQAPKLKSITSSQPNALGCSMGALIPNSARSSHSASTPAACSTTVSRPVIPKETRPSLTKVGMSAAGRKTKATGRFLTRAMSRRDSLRNFMSAPSSRLSVACNNLPSELELDRYYATGLVAYSLGRRIRVSLLNFQGN